jgi:hypothetical protein
MYSHVYKYTCLFIYTYTYVYIYINICICIYVYIYAYEFKHWYVSINMYTGKCQYRNSCKFKHPSAEEMKVMNLQSGIDVEGIYIYTWVLTSLLAFVAKYI